MTATPLRASDFIASVSVNTHINYNDGAYTNLTNIVSDLAYLGITHVRDGLNTPGQFGGPSIAAYETVARAGIKFTLMVGGGGPVLAVGGTPTNPSLDQRVGYIAQLARMVPGSVAAVEGTNEINNQPINYDGQGGTGAAQLEAALSLQRALYGLVHSDATLKGVPVYYFTGYDAGGIPLGPDPLATPGLADFNTQHPYPNGGDPPADWVSRARALPNETAAHAAAKAPAVYTETGYSSNGGVSGAVNLDVQAKYTLDLLLDAAANGIGETDLYELLDAYAPGSPQSDAGYGLFDYQGNAKPVAVAIHNLNIILTDPGAAASTFMPSTLPYTVGGASGTGHNLEMARSDGSHVIALWDEQPIWNTTTGMQTAAAVHRVTVTLNGGTGSYTVSEYDPLQGTKPIAILVDVNQATIAMSDHPVFLVVSQIDRGGSVPVPALPPPPPPPPTPSVIDGGTFGTGADTLIVTLSEDSYEGNALATVSIDGKVLSPQPLTVTARHTNGDTETFAFKDNFGPGAHTVAVSFANDAYGGSSDLDRNLYVKSVSLNGQTTLAIGPNEVYHALSGPGDILGSGAMFWNGFAEFKFPTIASAMGDV